MSEPTNNYRSVYSLGASDGLPVGLLMGACIMCMVSSVRFPVLSLLGLAIFVAVPIIVWFYLRRAWVLARVPATFSAVWLHGICIFLFGSIISALMMYIALRYVEPGWIERQSMMAAERLSQDAETAQQARVLRMIIESGSLPSPIYTSISSIWLLAFTGSMWSLIFAFILTRVKRFSLLRVKYIENKITNEL